MLIEDELNDKQVELLNKKHRTPEEERKLRVLCDRQMDLSVKKGEKARQIDSYQRGAGAFAAQRKALSQNATNAKSRVDSFKRALDETPAMRDALLHGMARRLHDLDANA